MQYLLKNCGNCGAYTMEAKCPKCAGETKIAHPTKYSKEDKYAIYRRKELYPELFKD
ncbi:MAG: RNA-protein complex protein Nop10 [Candidatus Micrarchaeota archaeon]